MSKHLALRHRKELCARFALWEAMSRIEGKASNSDSERALWNFCEAFNLLLVQRIDETRDYIPLAEFVKNLFLEATDTGPSSHLSKYPELKQEFAERLRTMVPPGICKECSERVATEVCAGTELDDRVVERVGACIDPFRRLFKVVTDATRHYYKTYGKGDIVLPRAVGLSTEVSEKEPHDIPDYWVGGATVFRGKHSSEIILKICVRNFDWKSYLASLYVLFHEAVAHAYSGAREPPQLHDCFAEGWMDRVSFMIMTDFLSSDSECNEWKYGHMSEGEKMHSARCNRKKHPTPETRNRAKGVLSAEKVLALLGKLPESRRDKLTHFLRLSFLINGQQRDSDQMERFVTTLNAALPGDSSIPISIPTRAVMIATITDSFRAYLGSNDVDALIAKIGDEIFLEISKS